MDHYAVFLRGINVGGIRVPMAELKTCLNELDLADVRTYLQTGNVTFQSEQPAAELKPLLEEVLSARFAYDAKVIIYPREELRAIVENYPFAVDPAMHRYAVLVADPAVIPELLASSDRLDPAIEQIAAGDGVLYWRVPRGSTLDSEFSKVLTKARFKPLTTVRNLNTLEKMAAA